MPSAAWRLASSTANLVCLALTGTMSESPPIAAMLHDEDATTTAFAEQALWSIWFRASDEQANRTLSLAVRIMVRDEYLPAIEWLSILALCRPEFAEAFNQRAVARFLVGQYEQAVRDTGSALRLNPLHFGAMATQGHCHVAQGEPMLGVEMYHAALQIHPRMEGIRETLEEVWSRMQRQQAGAGSGAVPGDDPRAPKKRRPS